MTIQFVCVYSRFIDAHKLFDNMSKKVVNYLEVGSNKTATVETIANLLQAFVNIVLALCDVGDCVVMFAPYYFNAYMSFQMTGVTHILVGPGDPKTLRHDAG